MNFQDKRMHPDDKRNIIIFFVACVSLFLLYDIFIYKPKMAEIKAAQQQAEIAAQMGTAPVPSPVTVQNRPDVLQQNRRISIDSDTIEGSLNLTGGRIDDLSLKHYKTEPQGSNDVVLLNPAGAPHAYYGEFGWVAQDQSIPLPSSSTRWAASGTRLTPSTPVTLTWSNGQGLTFKREIALDDNYMFSITQTVTNSGGKAVTLYPFALIGRDGTPPDMTHAYILHEGPIGYIGDELYEVDYKDLDDGEIQSARAENGWIGFTDKYWLTAVTPPKDSRGDAKFRFTGEPKANDTTHYQVDMMGTAVTIAAGESVSVPTQFFAGPKIVDMLADYSDTYNIPHFDLAVDFGIFYFLTRPFYVVLTFLNELLGHFAVALLVFTVLIKACVFPLAQKSYRSFARMRKVTPQMVELREKYGDDRVKLQAAIFELYKRENVNPVAGCVPLLIQIPIFFALYKVFYINIGMRHEPFWGWITDMSHMDPTNMFNLFGLIPWDPPSFLHIGAWPIIMGLTMALQQRLNPPPQDPAQKIMMGIMPLWITFILAKFPAGLVIYWSWSNTLSILQQYILLRQEGVRVNIFTRSRDEKKLEDMIEHGPHIHPEMEILDHEDIEPETKSVKPKKRKKKK